MNNVGTKQCKKCKAPINIKAKKCPYCGSSQGMPVWLIVIIVIVAMSIISNTITDYEEPTNGTSNGTSSNQQPEEIKYIKVSKDDLDEALENNAASAKEKYNKKYVEITGKLGTIDSDLKYISLESTTKEFDFNGVFCRIKNSEQKEIVKTLSSDQEITIRGKITDVGEVLGYYLDIIEIIANWY